uniref:Annexin 11 n=1 Tax=Spironucleus barkhanus TaxID=103874 RepID=A0A142C663_SPIBA|nr:annexin 11 [Spironucleus barkhanus]
MQLHNNIFQIMEFFRPTPALFPDDYQLASQQLKQILSAKKPDTFQLIALISQFNQNERVEIANLYPTEQLFSTFDCNFKSDFLALLQALFTPRYTVFAKLLNFVLTNSSKLAPILPYCITVPDLLELQKVENFAPLFEQKLGKLGLQMTQKVENCQATPEQLKSELNKGNFEENLAYVIQNLHFSFWQEFIAKNENFSAEIKEKVPESEKFIAASEAKNDMFKSVGKCLKLCVKGLGTQDEELIGLSAVFGDRMRNKIIKGCYDGDVVKELKMDLSGDYEKLVLAVWGLE